MATKKKIEWGREIGDALSFVFSGVKGIFSVIFCLFVTIGIIGLLCALICGIAFAVYLSGYVDSTIDGFEILATDQKQTSQIYVENESGELSELEDQKLYESENRVWVDYEEIPQYLIDAYVSTEDKRFFDHNGVDWIRTSRATVLYLIGRSDSGGSTLTQQLIKNITGDNDNTPQRKIEEIFRAINLEKEYSKEQILEMYLNTIYLSQGCNGVQSASYVYFGKSVSELSLVECAAIASITQNPSKWDPKIHPENNIIRRNTILNNMLDQGKITKAEYDLAYDAELVIYKANTDSDEDGNTSSGNNSATSWYVDAVIEDTIDLLMEQYEVSYAVAEQMLYTGGFKIVTAMDQKVQKILEDIYANDSLVDEIVGASPGMIKPQSAIVVVDPSSGNILGLVGGRGEKFKSRIFNYATQAKRQVGSAIKPLSAYGPALDKGIINYSTVMDDTPHHYEDGRAWPKNSYNYYKGLQPMISGITSSINTLAVKLVDCLGIDYSFKYLTEKLHFTTLQEGTVVNGTVMNDLTLASLALGGFTYGVTVREMVGGYTAFTNDGVFCEPRTVLKIYDSDEELVVDNLLKTEVAMSKENASIMTKMLNNVVVNGTATKVTLRNKVFCAGKTGTTSKNNDKWFVGYTPYYLGGVWFGYEKEQNLSNFSGNPSMKLWDYCMTKLHEELVFTKNENGDFNYTIDQKGNKIAKTYEDIIDPGVIKLTFCRDCGLLATDACKKDERGSRTMTGYYTVDNMPTEYCNCHVTVHYCKEGTALANEYCPDDCCEERVIVVNEIARDRYPNGKYVYLSDEKYVFYSNGDGTYKGHVSTYSKICKTHTGESFLTPLAPQSAVQETVYVLPPEEIYSRSREE